MKNNMLSFIMMILSVFLISCSDDDGGKSWDPQLSTNELVFSYESNEKSVTSKKDIQEIKIPRIGEMEDTDCIISYDESGKIEKIEGDWYTIQVISVRNINVEVKINDTNVSRTMFLPVLRGNYYGGITIIQDAQN